MSLPEFSPIRLTTDRFLDEGVGVGAVGFILDVFADGYDVEFSRPEDGSTIALLFLKADIEPAPEAALRPEHASVQPAGVGLGGIGRAVASKWRVCPHRCRGRWEASREANWRIGHLKMPSDGSVDGIKAA